MSEYENFVVAFHSIHSAPLSEVYDYLKKCGWIDEVKESIITCYDLMQANKFPNDVDARERSVLVNASEEDQREFFILVLHDMYTGERDGALYKEMFGETHIESTLLAMKLNSKE